MVCIQYDCIQYTDCICRILSDKQNFTSPILRSFKTHQVMGPQYVFSPFSQCAVNLHWWWLLQGRVIFSLIGNSFLGDVCCLDDASSLKYVSCTQTLLFSRCWILLNVQPSLMSRSTSLRLSLEHITKPKTSMLISTIHNLGLCHWWGLLIGFNICFFSTYRFSSLMHCTITLATAPYTSECIGNVYAGFCMWLSVLIVPFSASSWHWNQLFHTGMGHQLSPQQTSPPHPLTH